MTKLLNLLKTSAEKDDNEDTATDTIPTHGQASDVLETALMWFEGQPEADFISTMVSTGFSSFKIKEKYIMK